MSRIRSRLTTLSLNLNKVTKREQIRYINALKFGAKAWVDKAEEIIPVYSGASRASLDQIAVAVGRNVSTTPIPNAIRRLGSTKIAARQSKARSESRGGFKIGKRAIAFFYETSLQWLVDNELGEFNDAVAKSGNLITPIPYNFLEQADAAAQNRIQERLKGRTIDLRGTLDIKTVISK